MDRGGTSSHHHLLQRPPTGRGGGGGEQARKAVAGVCLVIKLHSPARVCFCMARPKFWGSQFLCPLERVLGSGGGRGEWSPSGLSPGAIAPWGPIKRAEREGRGDSRLSSRLFLSNRRNASFSGAQFNAQCTLSPSPPPLPSPPSILPPSNRRGRGETIALPIECFFCCTVG